MPDYPIYGAVSNRYRECLWAINLGVAQVADFLGLCGGYQRLRCTDTVESATRIVILVECHLYYELYIMISNLPRALSYLVLVSNECIQRPVILAEHGSCLLSLTGLILVGLCTVTPSLHTSTAPELRS